MKNLILYMLFSTSLYSYDLAICAVFQNEDFFLKEWIDFHKIVGVQHFYLYNNLSTDNYSEILKPYIDAGEVELFDWPVETSSEKECLELLQLPVYNHALKNPDRWIAFIDLDEFLFPVRHENLIEMLKEYEDFAGLSVNWQMYGTSGLDNLPENGSIIENLIYKAPTDYNRNNIIKMIVQPKCVKAINNPHYFDYHEGYFAVDSSKRRLPDGIGAQPVIIDTVRINHYWCGTRDWLIHQKLPRREKWGLVYPDDILELIITTFNQVMDDSILKFITSPSAALEPYKEFLENGTYEGQDWSSFEQLPKSRYDTFKMAFELFEGKVVVELGTSRSFTHGGLPGCNLDNIEYWTPDQPENWDWGAGFFTRMCAECLSHLNPEIHTVDLIAAHIQRCKVMTNDFKHLLSYHVASSVDFLRDFEGKIDLVYLDTGDMTPIEPTALLQLEEAMIIVERDLIAPNGLILIDDVRNQTPKKFGEVSDFAKAKYSLPYLLENGFEIIADEYQVLLRKL